MKRVVLLCGTLYTDARFDETTGKMICADGFVAKHVEMVEHNVVHIVPPSGESLWWSISKADTVMESEDGTISFVWRE